MDQLACLRAWRSQQVPIRPYKPLLSPTVRAGVGVLCGRTGAVVLRMRATHLLSLRVEQPNFW